MSKFIKLIRKIVNRTSNVRPYTEEAHNRYMAEQVRKLMRAAFEAGVAYEQSKHYEDEDSEGCLQEYRRDPTEPDYEEWFKQKYK